MNIAVCITTLNEESSISKLIDALLDQSKKPDEIVFVDGGSTDKTVEIIRHFQQKDNRIKLYCGKFSRAQGRNYAIEIARDPIIAMTDAGCIPQKHWLKRISEPFKNPKIEMVAGFYKMMGDSALQRAAAVFLGVTSRKFNINFLPSTRSVAFTKELWVKVGGFPEKLTDTAEDTLFNENVSTSGARIVRVKNALVEWGMPSNLQGIIKKMYYYARGDAKSKLWFTKSKGLMSHNIKVLSVFARYLLFGYLASAPFAIDDSPIWLIFIILLYSFWAFRKVYLEENKILAGLWGIVLQYCGDFAVMAGFIRGLVK
jgi:glycosyltransferase involved in cell wall biosynthesis